MQPTRRVFLGASAATPVIISAIEPVAQALAPDAQSALINNDAQSALKIIMDLLIPASDGMPSASEAGGLAYLEHLMRSNKDAAAAIAKGLNVANAYSERSFKRPFAELETNSQIAALKEMEDSALGVFDALRAYVYESYYTQPAIWKLIGYELYPTDHMGPHLQPFDDSLLADVRKMPKLYRDA